jgi:hypothetical protein
MGRWGFILAGFLERVYDLLFFFRRSDMGRLTNQAVFLTVEKAAHLGGGLVLLVAVARLLGEEVLGIYAFAIAATAVFVPVLDAGLNSRAIKQVAGSQDWQAVFDAVAFRRRVGPWAAPHAP